MTNWITTKIETTTPEEETVNASCGKCNTESIHKVLATTNVDRQSSNKQIDIWMKYQVIQCQGCSTISFREVSQCSEDFERDDETGEGYYLEDVKYYPNRIAYRPLMRDYTLLPNDVYSIYKETHSALGNSLGIMAGFGIRAIVEAVCNDKKIKGKDLYERIEGLKEKGLIPPLAAEILHNLRDMGNDAAHEMRAHSYRALNAAFIVVENLLQNVYVIPHYAGKLPPPKKRRKKK